MACSSILHRQLEACQVKYSLVGQVRQMISTGTLIEAILCDGNMEYNRLSIYTMLIKVDEILSAVDIEQMLLDNNS